MARQPHMGGAGGPGGPNRGMIIQKPKNFKATVKQLLHYIGHRKYLLFLGFFFVLLNTGLSLIATSLFQPVIDTITTYAAGGDFSQGTSQIFRQLIMLAIAYLASVLCAFLQQKTMMHLAQRTINDLRRDLFNHVADLPVRYYDAHSHGEMMSRFSNDIDTVSEAINNSIATLFSSVISLIGIVFFMFYYCWPLAIVTILLAPLNMVAAGKMMKKSSRYFVDQQRYLGQVNGYIEETMSGQKVVQTFCHEDKAIQEFNEHNELLRSAASKAQGYAGMMMPIMMNINNISYALIAMLGGLIVLNVFPLPGLALTIGGLTVFLNFSKQFGRPINEIANQYNAIITAFAGAERIFEVMSQPLETADRPGAQVLSDYQGHVVFDHVTFGYHPDKTVLKDLSLYAKPGQKIAFVGSTGAGKTTITNLLTRFYDIDEGAITLDGTDIRDLNRDSLRGNIAMVLQDTHLFTGTVKENIRYGRLDATDEEVMNAAKLASAHSFIIRLPNGYDTLIEGDGANLSQGQRQLLNIARAAIADTPILVLDEATSSVDTRTERHIEHGLDRLMKGRTTFIIAHRLSTVRNANAIMVLEHGQIIERGNHEQLLAQKGRYYQLYTGAAELD